MAQSRTGQPTAWTWILGPILVIAILWIVFAMNGRNTGSRNERLPRAQIRARSMIASAAAAYQAACSSAVSSV